MIRTFQIFEQLLDLFEVRQSQLHGPHDKRFSDRLPRGRQAQPQKAIYRLFEGFAGLADFLVQQRRHVVIECESGPHIMMLVR